MSILCAHIPDASRALPEFPDIDLQGKPLPDGVELEHIKSFQVLYREHCEVNYYELFFFVVTEEFCEEPNMEA